MTMVKALISPLFQSTKAQCDAMTPSKLTLCIGRFRVLASTSTLKYALMSVLWLRGGEEKEGILLTLLSDTFNQEQQQNTLLYGQRQYDFQDCILKSVCPVMLKELWPGLLFPNCGSERETFSWVNKIWKKKMLLPCLSLKIVPFKSLKSIHCS